MDLAGDRIPTAIRELPFVGGGAGEGPIFLGRPGPCSLPLLGGREPQHGIWPYHLQGSADRGNHRDGSGMWFTTWGGMVLPVELNPTLMLSQGIAAVIN